MRRIFIDTGAYIALVDRRDQYHDVARRRAASLVGQRLHICTTAYIFAETVTWMTRKLGHATAVEFGNSVRRQQARGQLDLILPSGELEEAAWQIFTHFSDQAFSYVDCTSFAWLKSQRDVQAFTFDHHFRWMGFSLFEDES